MQFTAASLRSVLVASAVACGVDGGGSGGPVSTDGSTGEGSTATTTTGSTPTTGGDDGSSGASVAQSTGESGTGGGTEGATTGTTGTGGGDTGGVDESLCEETATTISCPKVTIELGPWQRDVHYQVPLGEPPAGGWPVVLMFQGSFFSAEITWVATDDLPFGAYYQTRTVKRLLDGGFAVITPEAKLDGGTFWDTNVPPYSLNWESSEDHLLMLEIFAAIEDGTFGPLDPARLFATGISSGGYMTSRMAVSYPGKFRALAIAAGSYATCSGPLCVVPDLDGSHPPTLFLHGEIDVTVPLATAEAYYEELVASQVDARLVTEPTGGHAWIPASPDEVFMWFAGHP